MDNAKDRNIPDEKLSVEELVYRYNNVVCGCCGSWDHKPENCPHLTD